MNLIFLGSPGSGKGTQAIKVAAKFNLIHLSTGDILREAVRAQTELGKKADEYISKGNLVPDDLIIGIIENKISSGELSGGFILDGFPRTIPQAESLKKMFAENSIIADHAVLLNVSDETIIERIKGRAMAEDRTDDAEAVVRNRLEVYNKYTKPLVQFYKEESLLIEVNGEAPMDEVFDRLVNAVS